MKDVSPSAASAPSGAGTYTHGHHESVLRSHSVRTAQDSAAYLLPHLRPGLDLLDVGSGPGSITADFARLVAPGGTVTAVEATEAAMALTRATCAQRSANVRTLVSDVHDLALPDDSFDVVHAHQVIQHVADPVRALTEMRRVCRQGGLVAARDSDYGGFMWYPRLPELDAWLSLYARAARANGGEPDAGRYLPAWMHQAGFQQVTVTASVWCFADDVTRAWWGEMWSERILKSALAGQLLAAGWASGDDLDAISRAWLRWASDPSGLLVIPHVEVIGRK